MKLKVVALSKCACYMPFRTVIIAVCFVVDVWWLAFYPRSARGTCTYIWQIYTLVAYTVGITTVPIRCQWQQQTQLRLVYWSEAAHSVRNRYETKGFGVTAHNSLVCLAVQIALETIELDGNLYTTYYTDDRSQQTFLRRSSAPCWSTWRTFGEFHVISTFPVFNDCLISIFHCYCLLSGPPAPVPLLGVTAAPAR